MAEPKNKGGRTKIYTDVSQMELDVDAYFKSCDERMDTVWKDGEPIAFSNPAPYTMSGLAYSLGMDRRSLLNYSNDEEFFPTITKARSKVAIDVETRLMEGKAVAGAIFSLKNNFGWKDKTEVESSGELNNIMKIEFVKAKKDK